MGPGFEWPGAKPRQGVYFLFLVRGIWLINSQMQTVFVIGASAGGVDALKSIVGQLPAGFLGSLFIVLHMSPDHPSQLPEILQLVSRLPVQRPQEGQLIEAGHIYVAIPNHHLMLEGDKVRLISGPKENRFRPSVDALFRSAARAQGPKVVGVVLTGGMDDGTAGLYAIKARGGLTIVQDPDEAYCSWMPQSAIDQVEVDHVMRLDQIGPLLVELSERQASSKEEYLAPPYMDSEVGVALGDNGRMKEIVGLGNSALTPVMSATECSFKSPRAELSDFAAMRATPSH
ncbi:MAG: chemotaxis protein CheB, partial [Verrucomicrobiaceae bacterium]